MTPEEQELSNAIRDRYRTHRDKRSRVDASLMMLVVGGLMLVAAFFVYLAYDTAQDIPITSLGAEVQTTDKYGQLFNDSFSGRVVLVTRQGGFVVTVRDAEGTEKKFACKWLEAADAKHEKREG